jgi:hypothetical protein
VFVSVKDAKPKRKVAVPIPEGGSWESFLAQVRSKLKLSGIAAVYLASTGEQVTSLDDLQDIDELHVVAGVPSGAASTSGANGYGSHPINQHPTHAVGVADAEITPDQYLQLEADTDGNAKYVKRQSSMQRAAKRVFPSFFSAGLPLTKQDLTLSPVEQVRRRIRRRRRSWTDPRTLLISFAILSTLGTLALIYYRAAQGLP